MIFLNEKGVGKELNELKLQQNRSRKNKNEETDLI